VADIARAHDWHIALAAWPVLEILDRTKSQENMGFPKKRIVKIDEHWNLGGFNMI
jgi:hypothetical protein